MEDRSNETTPLIFQITDTLSVIFGHLTVPDLGQVALVSKQWKFVTDHYLILNELVLKEVEPASRILSRYKHAKSIKLPSNMNLSDKCLEFYTNYYPKALDKVRSITFPTTFEYTAQANADNRAQIAKLLIEPLPKETAHYNHVCFWPEFFDLITQHSGKNVRTLSILVNRPGFLHASWESLYKLVQSCSLETLGLHYFDSLAQTYPLPNMEVVTDNIGTIMKLATNLQRLNIPPRFITVDQLVQSMPVMDHLTYLYIQSNLVKHPAMDLLEKCKKLRLLHVELQRSEGHTEIFSSASLQTLLVSGTERINFTIDCPKLEVLKISHVQSLGDFTIHEHNLEEFTSSGTIKGNFTGDLRSVKICNDKVLFASTDDFTFPNLEKLTLSCDVLRPSIAIAALTKLSLLTKLNNLELENFRDLPDFTKYGSSNLTRLVLSKCATRFNEFHFKDIPHLTELQVIETTELTSFSVSNCPALLSLILHSNNDLHTLQLKDVPQLEKIDVRNTSLNLTSWRQIEKCPQIKIINSSAIPMSSVLKLMELRPNAQIRGKKMVGSSLFCRTGFKANESRLADKRCLRRIRAEYKDSKDMVGCPCIVLYYTSTSKIKA